MCSLCVLILVQGSPTHDTCARNTPVVQEGGHAVLGTDPVPMCKVQTLASFGTTSSIPPKAIFQGKITPKTSLQGKFVCRTHKISHICTPLL